MLICDISIAHKYGKLALDTLLSPLQVCWQEMVVLLALAECPEAPQHVLGQLLQTDKGNVTKLLVRMEEKGLLTRRACREDRRRRRNALSDAGARLIPALRQALADWEAACFSGLSPKEIDIYNKASKALIDNAMEMVKGAAREEAS